MICSLEHYGRYLTTVGLRRLVYKTTSLWLSLSKPTHSLTRSLVDLLSTTKPLSFKTTAAGVATRSSSAGVGIVVAGVAASCCCTIVIDMCRI